MPLDVCARSYLSGVIEHVRAHPDSSLREVRLCVFAGPLTELVAQEMSAADNTAG